MPSAASSDDLDISILEAAEAQKAWAALTAGARARVLEHWANSLENNTPLLAQLITAENVKMFLRRLSKAYFYTLGMMSPFRGKWMQMQEKKSRQLFRVCNGTLTKPVAPTVR